MEVEEALPLRAHTWLRGCVVDRRKQSTVLGIVVEGPRLPPSLVLMQNAFKLEQKLSTSSERMTPKGGKQFSPILCPTLFPPKFHLTRASDTGS